MKISSSSDDIQSIKVVLVGESGTGKTSIIQKYCKDVFTDDANTTLGCANETKVIHLSNQKQIKLNLWDTAGQETFRSLNKIFYKDAQIVILVYDITSCKSFQEIVNYWYYETKSHISNDAGKYMYVYIYMYLMILVIGILGNKSDLFMKGTVNESEAQQFADENELLFQLVSAKLNNSCIDMFFKEITEKCLSVINANNNNNYKHKRTVKLKGSKSNKTKKQCC